MVAVLLSACLQRGVNASAVVCAVLPLLSLSCILASPASLAQARATSNPFKPRDPSITTLSFLAIQLSMTSTLRALSKDAAQSYSLQTPSDSFDERVNSFTRDVHESRVAASVAKGDHAASARHRCKIELNARDSCIRGHAAATNDRRSISKESKATDANQDEATANQTESPVVDKARDSSQPIPSLVKAASLEARD